MRTLAATLLLLAAAASIGLTQRPSARPPIEAVQKIFVGRIDRADPADPLDLLVMPQGVYLPGYGVVFTVQVNLIVSPTVNPFRQEMTKPEIARVRSRKLQKLPLLRQTMKEMLLGAASSLDSVPPSEQVVLAVSLFHHHWEDKDGMPQQIVMHAPRKSLLNRSAAIAVEEY